MQTDPENARRAGDAKRTARIAAAAGALRDAAQARYNVLVEAQQQEMLSHQSRPPEEQLDVFEHLAKVRALSEAITAIAPQLTVDYWTEQATQQIAALEARGA